MASPAAPPDCPPGDRNLCGFLPSGLPPLDEPQTALPRIAKDKRLTQQLESAARQVPTTHTLHLGDAREPSYLEQESLHLVLTSPPYWTLKDYRTCKGQLGHLGDYEEFLVELDKVWRQCFRALVPGGRLVCVVGDVCLSRRKNNGRHTVVPLHASIQEHCRGIGFDNLAPIIWYKIANAAHEVENGSSFLGKPYEPNAVIKNDIEFVLMQRKPGGYRQPSLAARVLSVISEQRHRAWFQQIWRGLTGASTRYHPAPFPLELAERLVRMFSFVGDTVLDPFAGTGTTNLAAANWGRNSIGCEIDPHYVALAESRLRESAEDLFGTTTIRVEKARQHYVSEASRRSEPPASARAYPRPSPQSRPNDAPSGPSRYAPSPSHPVKHRRTSANAMRPAQRGGASEPDVQTRR